MFRGICAALLVVLVSCVRPGTLPAPKLPESKARGRRTPPPEWFWEPVDAAVRPPSRRPLDLPVADVARTEGAARVWDELSAEARERLRRDGVLVVGHSAEGRSIADPEQEKRTRSMGAFYMNLRDQRIPHVITLDALFAIVHLGLERALAHVEELELAPALHALLEKLDARLGAEEGGAGTELGDAYRVARGVVAVARSLEATAPWTPPPDLANVVAEERGHIEGHAGASTSPLLGVTLDYSHFAVPSAAARPGAFRALAWLGAAPLTLVARSEAQGSPIGVAQARTNARAAMLLARVCDRDVDASLHTTYTRMLRLFAFVWGPPDDLSLVELDDIAESIGIDVTKPENIANVARVDKLRARALAGRAPAAYDGSGGMGRAGVSVRVFGGHASADSLVMQSLVGAPVGLAQESAASASIDRLRNGQRVLPSTLDVVAWFGAPEAQSALHETHADAFDRYDAALASLQRTRPSDQSSALHASVHGSLVDSLIAWANASDGTTNGGGWAIPKTPPADRLRVESILAAWTLTRHAGQALARPRPAAPLAANELRVSGAPLPIFVEPIPDVVARLVAVVRQMRRGLEQLAPLAPSARATMTLVEIEDVLRAALKGAERHASDEALSTEEASALASLPARIARLEEESPDLGPVVAVVYSDPVSHRVLATATGTIEPVLMLSRQAGKDEPLLVVGAHVAHHELVDGFEHAPGVLHGVRPALTDASWRARLKDAATATPKAGGPAPGLAATSRGSWVASFRWMR